MKINKKLHSVIAASVLLLVQSTKATDYGDWRYNLVTNGTGTATVTLLLYLGTSNVVTIPSNIEGYSVTDIEGAFCENSKLTSVSIPDSVTTIGHFAFASSSLTNIVIPNSVTNVGNYVFNGCVGLTSVSIPASVTTIGDGAFSQCRRLTNIYFLGNAPSAAATAFDGTTNVSIYYRVGTSGWSTNFCDFPTVPCTATTPVMVPHTWLDQHFEGLTNDNEYEQSAMADQDGDGMATWQEYLAGTDPTDSTSRFQVTIIPNGGAPPNVSWFPNLGSDRIYVVMGKTNFTDSAWTTPPNDGDRFFLVLVKMS